MYRAVLKYNKRGTEQINSKVAMKASFLRWESLKVKRYSRGTDKTPSNAEGKRAAKEFWPNKYSDNALT